jgi:hypothetical protein
MFIPKALMAEISEASAASEGAVYCPSGHQD